MARAKKLNKRKTAGCLACKTRRTVQARPAKKTALAGSPVTNPISNDVMSSSGIVSILFLRSSICLSLSALASNPLPGHQQANHQAAKNQGNGPGESLGRDSVQPSTQQRTAYCGNCDRPAHHAKSTDAAQGVVAG